MGYQKNERPKFRTKNWFEINYVSHGTYSTSSQIKFKNLVIRSSLCDYTNAYILRSGRITITGEGADNVAREIDKRE